MKKQSKNNKTFLYLKQTNFIPKKTPLKRPADSNFQNKQLSGADPFASKIQIVSPSITEHNGIDNWEEEVEDEIDMMESLSRYNEGIIEILDQFPEIGSFFDIAPSNLSSSNLEDEEAELLFSDCIGTYANLIKHAENQGITKEILDQGFDIQAAHKYALFQIWVKAEDAHGGNILIRLSGENTMIPIPLDFGRCLGYDLENGIMLPRTTRWEKWPALEHRFDDTVKNFIIKQNTQSLIDKLKKLFFGRYSAELSEEQKAIFSVKLQHLHANMIMVQEAMKEGLTMKQILALILPIIDINALNFVTQGITQGGELWPARKRFASLKTSFREAWDCATQLSTFNSELFREKIGDEVREIKKLSLDTLNTLYFPEISFELRRSLYL